MSQDSETDKFSRLSVGEKLKARNLAQLQLIPHLGQPLEVKVVDFVKNEVAREYTVTFSPKNRTAQIRLGIDNGYTANVLLQDGKLFHAGKSGDPWSLDSFTSEPVFSDVAEALSLATRESFLVAQNEAGQIERLKSSLSRAPGSQNSAPRFLDLLEEMGRVRTAPKGPFEWTFPLRVYKGEIDENGVILNVSVFDNSGALKRVVSTSVVPQPAAPQFMDVVSAELSSSENKKPWGVAFVKAKNEYPVVSSVLSDSSAERGGIQFGMKIISIEGQDVLTKSWEEIFQLFGAAGDAVTLSVIDEKSQSSSLKLKR